MTTIETLSNGESGLIHRTKINDNFTNVNNDKVETSDYTDANVKTKYENNADTNAFTDAEKTKLSSLTPGGVDSVNGEVGAVVLNQDDILDGTTFKQYSNTEKTKLAGITAGAQPNAVASVNGQTGTVVVSKSDVGLGDVDNTSDADKPVSTATQTALDGKENSFAKNTAFNKNFGTVTGTVAEGSALSNKQDALGYSPLEDVIAGSNVTIDKTNPLKPIINASGGGGGGGAVDSVFGRTGVVTAQSGDYTKAQVGLGNVDNTSDANKPVSTATQTELDTKLDSVVAGTNVTIDNTDPNNPVINASGGGGGGAVDSVNSKTGVVVLDTSDISDTTDARYITDAQQTVLSNTSGTNTGDQDLSGYIESDTTGVTGADQVNNIISLTQAEYDAITPDSSTIYNITDSTPSLDFVDKISNETIGGIKTFTDSPIIPAPTTDLQPATKKYVDDNAGGGGSQSNDFGLIAGIGLSKGDFYRYGIASLSEDVTKMYKTTTDTVEKATARGVVTESVVTDAEFTGLTNGTQGGYTGLFSLTSFSGSFLISQTANNSNDSFPNVPGQTFTLDKDIKLTQASFYRLSGGSSNTFNIEIYDDVGTLLHTSDNYVSSSQGQYNLTFSAEPVLAAGDYELRVTAANPSVGLVAYESTDVYTGGTRTRNGVAQTGDLYFRIVGTPQVSGGIDVPVYIQDDGTLDLIPGTVEAAAGTIVSDTEVRISDKITSSISTTATTGGVVLGNAEGYVTIKINGVDKKIPYYGV